MKWKEFVTVLLLGVLLPLVMFLIAENWHGPDEKTEESTVIETINETQPEVTVLQQ